MPDRQSLYDALSETWPARMAKDVWEAAKAPGNAYAGRLRMTDDDGHTSMDAIKHAADLAGVLGLQVPGAPKGAAGIFGGRLAKTADLDALERAKELAAQGMKNDDIRYITGWHMGPDHQWRFEIPDNNLTVNTNKMGTGKASDFVDHPELFEAYPQLRDMPMDAREGTGGGGFNSYGGGSVRIEHSSPQNAREATAHEFQHAVQNLEGFDPGANPQTYVNVPFAERPLAPNGKPMQTFSMYLNTTGEREANAALDRMDMSPAQRRAITPDNIKGGYQIRNVDNLSARLEPLIKALQEKYQ